MSVIENARQKQMEQRQAQQFVPVREGLAGYYGDDSGFREANAIRPTPSTSPPRQPNRVLSPEQARALQAQQEMRTQELQNIEAMSLGNEAARPQMIRR